MTLLMSILRPEGIYMSVDFRLTNSVTQEVLDDEALKMVRINHGLAEGSPVALWGYSGVAEARDRTPMSDWLRETVRGGNEGFDAMVAHLEERLNRDVAPWRQPFILNVTVMRGGQRYFGGFSNLKSDLRTVTPTVTYQLIEVTDPFCYTNGGGALTARGLGLEAKLVRQIGIDPRDPRDYCKLLASINRKVAAKDRAVSPACHVVFLGQDASIQSYMDTFKETGERAPMYMPMIFGPIDNTGMFEHGLLSLEAMKAGAPQPEWNEDIAKKSVQRRP